MKFIYNPMKKKINIAQKLSQFKDHWNPRIIELNHQHVKLAKLKGNLFGTNTMMKTRCF